MSAWSPMGPDVSSHVRDAGSGWSLRSIALAIPGGGHAVLAAGLEMDPGELEPRFLVATNHFHWMGIPEWRARFPNAAIVATSVAAPRLRSKLGADVGLLANVPLPDGARWIEPPGVGSGEAWLDVGGTWFVCDAFFNEPNVAPGVRGIGLRLTETTPGLRIGQTWKWMQLSKRAEYKSWLLEMLERSPPKRLVPAHGDPIEQGDLGSRLADLVRARL